MSLEKVPLLRFLLRFPTCNGHSKSLISAFFLRRIGSNFKPGMTEGRREEGGKRGSFIVEDEGEVMAMWVVSHLVTLSSLRSFCVSFGR